MGTREEIAEIIKGKDHASRSAEALEVLIRYGQIDGDHHKAWVIDQAVRALSGGSYDRLIAWANDGEDGPETYTWDEGIPP